MMMICWLCAGNVDVFHCLVGNSPADGHGRWRNVSASACNFTPWHFCISV